MPAHQHNHHQACSIQLTNRDVRAKKSSCCVANPTFFKLLRYLVGVMLVIGMGHLSPHALASESVAQIRVVHRNVSEMLTIVQPLISPQGYISADAASNSLIVIDHPAYIDRIRKLVAQIDQPVAQLKIRVRFGPQKAKDEQSASARVDIKAGDTTIEAGDKKDGGETDDSNATIEIGDQEDGGTNAKVSSDKGRRRDTKEYTVFVRSGGTAYISSGSDVAYPERWSNLSHRYGYNRTPIKFKKVDTGYDVRPILKGKMVQIDITPHISYVGPRGLRRPIRFAEAVTRLQAPLGVWVEIDGTGTQQQEINRQILGAGRASDDEQLTMQLMVTLN
jgi:hypothetical protein